MKINTAQQEREQVAQAYTTINIPVTPELKRRFRIAAAFRGVSMAEAGRRALERWLKDNEPQPA